MKNVQISHIFLQIPYHYIAKPLAEAAINTFNGLAILRNAIVINLAALRTPLPYWDRTQK